MIENIVDIAERAGKIILSHYEEVTPGIIRKEDNSPLTQADLAAHELILSGLKELTPEIPVISEEGEIAGYEERRSWKQFWLVDPLDGTREFIKKNGEFTVNIALIRERVPVLGVVHIPVQKLTYTGEEARGSFRIGSDGVERRIVSSKPDRSRPLTIVASRSHGSDNLEEKLASLQVTVGETVRAGSSLKFCLVAEGRADLYPRLGPTMEWDTAAGDAVFRYSGAESVRPSPIHYNKVDLRNDGFIIGLD